MKNSRRNRELETKKTTEGPKPSRYGAKLAQERAKAQTATKLGEELTRVGYGEKFGV